MFKDNYSVKNSLKKLFLQRYERYLPTAFDESMSILEKMNKLIETQNALIDVVNAHKDHTSDQLERAFDIIDNNLDLQLKAFRDELIEQKTLYEEIRDKIHSDLLPDSVRQILEEWELDGTIESMLSEHVLTEINMRLEDVENRVEENENNQDVSLTRFSHMAEMMDNGELDWTVPLKHAIENHDYVVIPEGEFNIKTIQLNPEHSNKSIIGRGDSTVINLISGSDLFEVNGELGQEKPVSVSYEYGSREVFLGNVNDLSSGDDIMIKSQKNALNRNDAGEDWILGNGTGTTTPQKVGFGEFLTIEEVLSDRITLVSPTIYPFYASHNQGEENPIRNYSTVQKVDFAKNIKIKDFSIGKLDSGFVLRTKYAKNIVLDGVKFIDRSERSVARGMCNIIASLLCEVRNSEYIAPRDIGFNAEYWKQNPYKITSSQNTGVVNCKMENAAQGVDISYLQSEMVSTSCYVKDCRSLNQNHSGFTTHGGNYLTVFTGNYVEGVSQGISHRGRGGIITNNVIVGTSFNRTSTLVSGIALYQAGSADTIISNNQIRNFSNGIGYSDGGHIDGGRVMNMNTIISNNIIDNCRRAIYIFRYHTGGVEVPKQDMGISIVNNHIKMKNNTDSTTPFAIVLNERVNGVVIRGNTIKGIEGEMVGFTGDRTNNFYGIDIGSNADNITVADNRFIDIDRAITHAGTTSPQTPNLFPDGVVFREKDNERLRVRLNDTIRSGVRDLSNVYMEARVIQNEHTIPTTETKLRYYGATPFDLRNPDDLGQLVLSKGLWSLSYQFNVTGLVNLDGTVEVSVIHNNNRLIKAVARENEHISLDTLINAKDGDTVEIRAFCTNAERNAIINGNIARNRFVIAKLN